MWTKVYKLAERKTSGYRANVANLFWSLSLWDWI